MKFSVEKALSVGVGLLPEALWNVPLNPLCLESTLLTLPAL